MPSSFMLMGDCRVLYISQYLSATLLTQISCSAVSGHIHLQQRLVTISRTAHKQRLKVAAT